MTVVTRIRQANTIDEAVPLNIFIEAPVVFVHLVLIVDVIVFERVTVMQRRRNNVRLPTGSQI